MFSKYDETSNTYTLSGYDNLYYISSKGIVTTQDLEQVKRHEDESGRIYVLLPKDGKTVRVYVKDLMVMKFKWVEKHLPKSLWGEVESFVIDGDENNLVAKNIGYRFKTIPLEHPTHKGWFIIPEHLRLGMSEKYEVKNFKTGAIMTYRTVKPSKNGKYFKGGYKVTHYKDKNVGRTISRHRAMVMTFKGYPDNIDFMQVNHINGIPGDDRFDNLEIVTPASNLDHAYRNGLRTQNKPVKALNLYTGEIIDHHSITSAAVACGISDMVVGDIVNGIKKIPVSNNGYSFKFADDPTPWIIVDNVDDFLRGVRQANPILCKNCSTGEINEVESSSQAGLISNIHPGSILYRINKGDYSPLFGWQFVPANMGIEFPEFTADELEKSLIPSAFIIHARNILTDEEITYHSIAKAEKAHKRTFAERLRNGIQPLYPDGWQFKSALEDWNEIDDPVKTCRLLRKEIVATCQTTQNKIIFESARQASLVLQGCPKALRAKAILPEGGIYRNYHVVLGNK